ncbi:hypothetical protein [Anaerobacillus arseniciselenatis]|uniref:hypothetical protein n=1 Tax=Anaerobacillus arseniciselenatis TaxID=85682 RepID=UPI00147216F6|nr:hypothetical protein [Anaerobacillus arseniciselenatis]
MELNILTLVLLFSIGLGIGWLYKISKYSEYQVEQNKKIINLLEQLTNKQNNNGE